MLVCSAELQALTSMRPNKPCHKQSLALAKDINHKAALKLKSLNPESASHLGTIRLCWSCEHSFVFTSQKRPSPFMLNTKLKRLAMIANTSFETFYRVDTTRLGSNFQKMLSSKTCRAPLQCWFQKELPPCHRSSNPGSKRFSAGIGKCSLELGTGPAYHFRHKNQHVSICDCIPRR